jgi:hypothetical protein
MQTFFICNQDQVELKLKSLTKTGASKDGWTFYYRDDDTKEEWLLKSYESEFHAVCIRVLKRLPQPTMEELIDIALTSSDKSDIIGASFELSERERDNEEDFRQKLLTRLQELDTSNLSEFEKERLKLVIYESDLYNAMNRKKIVGKHFSEIQKDADHYRTIAEKAKKILVEIGK